MLLGVLATASWVGLAHGPAFPADLTGQVTDGERPLAGARVHFQGQCPVAVTDRHGRFRLPRSFNPAHRLMVSREGFLIRGFAADRLTRTLVLPCLPEDDPTNYTWVEPGPEPAGSFNCANCHEQIYKEWQRSGHARSADNPHFLNLYDGSDWHGRRKVGWNLRADNPDGAAVCAACHAPTVTAADPAFDDLRLARGVARRGVHCDFCHKITDAAVDARGLTFGRFGYQLCRPARGQFFLGPLDDAERMGESFAYAPFYKESRYCASCHEGVVFGVPVYTTYSEWLTSPARHEGKQCQSCHMASTGALTNVAPGKGGIQRDPSTLAAHRFPGANGRMLRRCLAVTARVVPKKEGARVEVEVRANGVGHRVPTGFIDRNLVLVVEAFDRAGRLVPLHSGPVLPSRAGRELAAKPGRIYAKQLMARDGPEPIPFWRPHTDLVDTRLQPGRADRRDFLFAGNVDRVRVRLLHRRFWKDVADTKRWPDNEITVVDRIWRDESSSRPRP
jgi:hypothetical protein